MTPIVVPLKLKVQEKYIVDFTQEELQFFNPSKPITGLEMDYKTYKQANNFNNQPCNSKTYLPPSSPSLSAVFKLNFMWGMFFTFTVVSCRHLS